MKGIFDKNHIFVKPLYKKVSKHKVNAKIHSITVDFDNKLNLDGHDCQNEEDGVKKLNKGVNFKKTNIKVFPFVDKFLNNKQKRGMNIKTSENEIYVQNVNAKPMFSFVNKTFNQIQDGWLRLYPAIKEKNEKLTSLIIRCCFCQLGIMTFLVIATLIATFVIHSIEGPHEQNLSNEYDKKQNQLVIDLATELRQITPLSPKWRQTIERRLQDERRLTIAALGRGVKLEPGSFWSLSGTFLFNIYVMTALGFGAPVPQTIPGRTAALLYAVLTIPLHFVLLMNLSSCIVFYVEKVQKKIINQFYNGEKRNDFGKGEEYVDCKGSRKIFLQIFSTCISYICIGRGIPLTIILYYAIGASLFGVARNRASFDIILFPLEFTTSGGLEQIDEVVRFLYGLYVEGAIILLACTMATLRRCSSSLIEDFIRRYRLIESEN